MTFIDWAINNSAELANYAAAVGVFLAVATLIKGLLEWRVQNRLSRFDKFQHMRVKLKSNESFKTILRLAEHDSVELRSVDFSEKRDLLGFFEEIAIMYRNKLIGKDLCWYMFGYYAIRLYESTNFWGDVNRNAIYWSVFDDFAKDMKKTESDKLRSQQRINARI